MPQYKNNTYTVIDFEFPPVDYPELTGKAYVEFRDDSKGYGDMKSFICFDAGFRAALKFIERKLIDQNEHTASCKCKDRPIEQEMVLCCKKCGLPI